MRIVALLASAAALLFVTGCARVTMTTTVQKDGSFTREGRFTMSEGLPTPTPSAMPFQIPPSGNGVTVTKAKEKSDTVYTVRRSLPTGTQVSNDMVLLGKTKPMVTNTAFVRPLSNGQYEYVETIKWVGPKSENVAIDPRLRAAVKKALGPSANTQQIDRTCNRLTGAVWRLIFGPNEPMIANVLMHPDFALRRMRKNATASFNDILIQEGVPDAGRRELLDTIFSQMMSDKVETKQKEAEKSNDPSDAVGLTPLGFIVKIPGRIIETNGETDPTTNEVFWMFYAQSAEAEDVVLRVVFQP